jgi:hypothetical protein
MAQGRKSTRTDEMRDEVCYLYKKKRLSIPLIQERLHIGAKTVLQYLSEGAIPIRKSRRLTW